MLVRVLGPLEVEDGRSEVAVGGRQARRVLARLALAEAKPVSVDDLVAAAWAIDVPPTARHTIATHVLRLRRAHHGYIRQQGARARAWCQRP